MSLAAPFIGDLGDLITGLATTAVAIGGFVAGRTALKDYREQTREKRGRWLMELRMTLADREAYQLVRRQLYEERKKPGSSTLSKALRHKRPEAPEALSDEEMKALVALDDYLDFFELIKHLVDNDQLGIGEADQMFNWYVAEPMTNPIIEWEVFRNFSGVWELNQAFRKKNGLARLSDPQQPT